MVAWSVEDLSVTDGPRRNLFVLRLDTPAQALAAGADSLVVGRALTAREDPRAAARALLTEALAA